MVNVRVMAVEEFKFANIKVVKKRIEAKIFFSIFSPINIIVFRY
jgi:hypothetical protein